MLQSMGRIAEATAQVLVIDDDPHVRTLLCWALEEEGFAVVAAADGQEAVDHLIQCRPALVLLDMGLPLIEGMGVADHIHTLYGAALPIVVITADGNAAEKGRRAGAIASFHKPFSIDALLDVVHQAIQAH